MLSLNQGKKNGLMKPLATTISVAAALLLAAHPHAQEPPPTPEPGRPALLQTNTWWNLYFSKDHDPLRRGGDSIRAVKVLEVDRERPSWIKIAFPKDRAEHLSIFKPAAKASADPSLSVTEALSEWEKTISDWQTLWVNLRFVVYVTKVEPDETP